IIIIKETRLLLLGHFFPFGSSSQDNLEIDSTVGFINRDSLGNLISHQEARALLQTGKYIAVPMLNSFMQIELVIRKPRKEDGDRYQTYANQYVAVSTLGLPSSKIKLGESIPSFTVTTPKNESLAFDQLEYEFSLLIFRKKKEVIPSTVANQIAVLIDQHPRVNYIFCSESPKSNSDSKLLPKYLSKYHNVYVAEPPTLSHFDKFSWYILIDKKREIRALVPPVPDELISVLAVKKALEGVRE
ncbi:MAG: hypothetical protein ACK5SL_09555, partial [Cyclobacteriaceae bacterium]